MILLLIKKIIIIRENHFKCAPRGFHRPSQDVVEISKCFNCFFDLPPSLFFLLLLGSLHSISACNDQYSKRINITTIGSSQSAARKNCSGTMELPEAPAAESVLGETREPIDVQMPNVQSRKCMTYIINMRPPV